MALSFSHVRSTRLQTQEDPGLVARRSLAPPGLLRCLVVSWSECRISLLRAAAEAEAWEAIACSNPRQFLRNVFQESVPLTLIDLPPASSKVYSEFRVAAVRAKDRGESLLVVSVAEGCATDELWARELGVWSYLPELTGQEGWELVFSDARQAIARQATAYLESSAQARPCRGT